MTISSEVRKAGPFQGNGATSSFPFNFKVLNADNLTVYQKKPAGRETRLTRGVDYEVHLNANQEAAPGGTVRTTTPLAAGYVLVISSHVPYLQPVNLTNQGGFYPNVINTALDRLTILTQQLREGLSRAVKTNISDTTTPEQILDDFREGVQTAKESARSAAASAAKAAAAAAEAESKGGITQEKADKRYTPIAHLTDANPHDQYAMKQHVVMNTGEEVKNVDLNSFGKTGIYRYDNSNGAIANAPNSPAYGVLEVINNGVSLLQRLSTHTGVWERSWRPAAEGPPAWGETVTKNWITQQLPNPANLVTTNTVQEISETKAFKAKNAPLQTATPRMAALEVQGAGSGSPAMMAFNVPGRSGLYFGMDADGIFKVGGWSWGGYKADFLYPNTPQAPGLAPVYGARAHGSFNVAVNNGNATITGTFLAANISSITVSGNVNQNAVARVVFHVPMADANYTVITNGPVQYLSARSHTEFSLKIGGPGICHFVIYR